MKHDHQGKLTNNLCKAVMIMAIVSMLLGLFGCRGAIEPTKHELSEFKAVSISCGNMDRSCAYSFSAHREESGWLFSGECFVQDRETEVRLEDLMMSEEDLNELFRLLECSGSIAYAESCQGSRKHRRNAQDETMYVFALTFTDGSQYVTHERQEKLEEYFYRIAEKHNDTSKTNNGNGEFDHG